MVSIATTWLWYLGACWLFEWSRTRQANDVRKNNKTKTFWYFTINQQLRPFMIYRIEVSWKICRSVLLFCLDEPSFYPNFTPSSYINNEWFFSCFQNKTYKSHPSGLENPTLLTKFLNNLVINFFSSGRKPNLVAEKLKVKG